MASSRGGEIDNVHQVARALVSALVQPFSVEVQERGIPAVHVVCGFRSQLDRQVRNFVQGHADVLLVGSGAAQDQVMQVTGLAKADALAGLSCRHVQPVVRLPVILHRLTVLHQHRAEREGVQDPLAVDLSRNRTLGGFLHRD